MSDEAGSVGRDGSGDGFEDDAGPSDGFEDGAGFRIGFGKGLLLWVGYAALALALYEPALNGPLHGDDALYLAPPFMQEISVANALAILDPTGEPAVLTTNYAPVHLFAHWIQGFLFGYTNLPVLHAINVVLHGVNAALLVALLAACGVPLGLGAAAGALFLFHPAQVEAVAWVTQLKTTLAFAFATTALLLFPRRPLGATVAFALALLSKPIAACALPAAVLFEWVAPRDPAGRGRRLSWLAGWAGLLLLYAVPAFAAFEHAGQFRALDVTGSERLQQAVAIVARYAVLATTGTGASISHEPDPPGSWVDPWWLGGLAVLAALVALAAWVLRRGHPAVPWLGFGAAAYLPVSQIFPFRYPMADRYLYFVLAGVLGAAAVALAPRVARAVRAWREPAHAAVLGGVGAGVLGLAVLFAVQTHARAVVWSSLPNITMDAALHYPNGTQAALLRAIGAVNRGDAEAALDALEAARARGYVTVNHLLSDPAWSGLHGHPRFVALAQDMARFWIRQWSSLRNPTQLELLDLAQVHLIVGEIEQSEAILERALELEGSTDPALIRARLEEVRRLRQSQGGA